jgi:hypothetical protein
VCFRVQVGLQLPSQLHVSFHLSIHLANLALALADNRGGSPLGLHVSDHDASSLQLRPNVLVVLGLRYDEKMAVH